MAESKKLQFESLDEMVRHFDTHDWGDYLAQMPQVEFDVDIKRRIHLVALDEDLADSLTEIARTRHVLSRDLVNTWLREKVLTELAADTGYVFEGAGFTGRRNAV